MNKDHEKGKILVVDDDSVTRGLLQEVLESEGYRVVLSPSGEDAIKRVAGDSFSVIVSDIRMLGLDGLAVLKAVKKSSPDSVVILMTGFGNMEGAIEAIQEGAFDYVSKPFKIENLKTVVARALKHWEASLKSKKDNLRPSGKIAAPPRVIIGKSPLIVEVYKMVARAALSSSPVLVAGESGTGKELVGRAIHDNGPCKNNKFIAVSCGSMAELQLESELFGHVKGSFAGAVGVKKGIFEEASGGTVFLDEIGEISTSLQIKLLRVLQEAEIRPIGSPDNIKVDVRTIAATHSDLEALVRAGKFREDLFYRLNVISIEIPPLRERMEDLPELVEHFLARYSEKNKKRVSHVSSEGMSVLRRYSWPGNIRELEHAIERAVAMTNSNVLFPEDFAFEAEPHVGLADKSTMSGASLEDLEKLHIIKVLQEVNYNKSRASEVLGIDRATLYRKAQRYGIDLRGK